MKTRYVRSGFRHAPADYYPGINALTLARLWEHITGRKSKIDLAMVSSGIRWAIDCAMAQKKEFWPLISRAEYYLLEEQVDSAIEDYSEAVALAVADRDRFALDSTSQQLDFLRALNFRPDLVAQAALIIDRGEEQLDALLGTAARAGAPEEEPNHVILFSGHMIDNPAVRGEGKQTPARFPSSKLGAVRARIRSALDEVGAGRGDLGLCGGTAGGDLLFAEACLERGMKLEVRLAKRESEFLRESVTFADPKREWERAYMAVTQHPASTMLNMPDELGPVPAGVNVHDRCNRWMLYSALSHGLRRTAFIAVWHGEAGDGPGGTQNMVEHVKMITGRQPIIIDPAQA
jgi:hypothetical protein